MKKYLAFSIVLFLTQLCFADYSQAQAKFVPGIAFVDCNITVREMLLEAYAVILPKHGSKNYSPKFDKAYQVLYIIKGELPTEFKKSSPDMVRWTVGSNPDRNYPEDQIHYFFTKPCK
jgi:hypothetical protein